MDITKIWFSGPKSRSVNMFCQHSNPGWFVTLFFCVLRKWHFWNKTDMHWMICYINKKYVLNISSKIINSNLSGSRNFLFPINRPGGVQTDQECQISQIWPSGRIVYTYRCLTIKPNYCNDHIYHCHASESPNAISCQSARKGGRRERGVTFCTWV